VSDDTQEAQRVKMVGLRGKNLAVERLGVRELAGPMALDRQLKCLRNRHRLDLRHVLARFSIIRFRRQQRLCQIP
jgi:hypothetical protein